MAHHFFYQLLRFRGAAAGVDVHAIRFIADCNHVGAKLVEHRRRDVVARAVRAVDDETQPAQVPLGRKRALAKFDVAAGGVIDAARFAKVGRRRAHERHVHCTLDFYLDRVRQLGARR